MPHPIAPFAIELALSLSKACLEPANIPADRTVKNHSAAKGGRIGVTDRAEPEPNPPGQEAENATMDADRLAANLHLDAQDDGMEPIVIRHPSADKNETLYQGAPEGARGWLWLLPNGAAEIGKGKRQPSYGPLNTAEPPSASPQTRRAPFSNPRQSSKDQRHSSAHPTPACWPAGS